MKIVVFNVKYSENVGDGVIAECLESALSEVGAQVETIDLAGRQRYGDGRIRGRAAILHALALLPSPAKRALVSYRVSGGLARRMPGWRAALADADLAIIGGGNLFQDDCLNFPLKIGAVLNACKLANVPVAIHAVGVVPGWSDAARALFSRVRDVRLVAASARDYEACIAWGAELGADAPPITLARDPGLLAMRLLRNHGPKPISTRPVIGLGVIHPIVLRHHAAPGAILAGTFEATLALVEELLARGMRIVLFGNGAGEDEKHLRRLALHPVIQRYTSSGLVSTALRPRTPSDLVATIAAFDGILAHRLHAIVVATALGRPSVGLGWDPKVGGFFRSIGYPQRVVEDQRLTSGDIADMVQAALVEGVDAARLATLVEEARSAIIELASISLDGEPSRRACA